MSIIFAFLATMAWGFICYQAVVRRNSAPWEWIWRGVVIVVAVGYLIVGFTTNVLVTDDPQNILPRALWAASGLGLLLPFHHRILGSGKPKKP